MSTRAIAWLKQRKIPHLVVGYDHAQKGVAFAAEAVGLPLAQTVKTLHLAPQSGGALALPVRAPTALRPRSAAN